MKGATADKCDMASDASFFVFSFGFPREFTMQRNNRSPDGTTGDHKKLTASDIVWQKALASGSLLKVAAIDNRTLYHALHKMDGAGERWSLIFRSIKTFIPVNPIVAAEVNHPMYRFVSKAQQQAGRHAPSSKEIEAFAKTQRSFQTNAMYKDDPNLLLRLAEELPSS